LWIVFVIYQTPTSVFPWEWVRRLKRAEGGAAFQVEHHIVDPAETAPATLDASNLSSARGRVPQKPAAALGPAREPLNSMAVVLRHLSLSAFFL
jgi:hypothetical protein